LLVPALLWITRHHLLGKLSALWAYVTLGATSIITEEAAPVLAGFAAHQGHLGLIRGGLSVAIGTWVADIGLYALGRWGGDRVVQRWPGLASPVDKLLDAVRRRPWVASLAVRYAYGARLLLPFSCGAAAIPLWLYTVGSGISAFTWSALFTAVGWAFGETAKRVLGHIRRYEDVIALSLVIAVAILVIIVQLRNRKRVPEEIGGR